MAAAFPGRRPQHPYGGAKRVTGLEEPPRYGANSGASSGASLGASSEDSNETSSQESLGSISGASVLSGSSGSSGDSGFGDSPPRTASGQGLLSAATITGGRTTTRLRRRQPAPEKYKKIEERLASFNGVDWPADIEAQPSNLAKAGFYYYGPDDRVKCAFCYGTLKRWLVNDSAIEEHIRHFPECTFVENIQKQTEVLTKHIRTKDKVNSCVSSAELIRHYKEQRENENRPTAKTMWRRTLRKMTFDRDIIQEAERRCKRTAHPDELSLESVLAEIHIIEKEEFFGTSGSWREDREQADEGVESDFEEEQEEEAKPVSVDEEMKKLEEELRRVEGEKEELERQFLCKVCLTEPADTLFMTCRHFVSCASCADRMRDCPLCRQLILGTVAVFVQ